MSTNLLAAIECVDYTTFNTKAPFVDRITSRDASIAIFWADSDFGFFVEFNLPIQILVE